jgi:multidrug efflux pump subunit AcrB
MSPRLRGGGPIAWMAGHSVAANLLMLVLILGGLLMSSRITQEVFPSFELDTVSVSVALPGATPGEVERSIILAVEEEMRGVQGVDTITATAREGAASITAELSGTRDRQVVYNDVEQAVSRITTFPEDAEEPVVRLDSRRREVVELQLYGEADRHALRMAAERVRERLLLEDGITQVELSGTSDLEIHVAVPQARLRAHGLTLGDIADTIRQAALDRAGGTLETRGGDLLLRLEDRRYAPADFAAIPVIAERGGTLVRLGDIATVSRGFADSDVHATYDGRPAIRIDVYRVGEETPLGVSEAVKRAVPDALATLPSGFDIATTDDDSEIYRGRMELLLKNGFIGLALVLVLLSLFLEFRLAFWVAVGIPTAFLGALLFLPWTGASINMVTMFAFILALGIVVDDAIVAGENIFEYRQRGMAPLDAAIQGARDIAVPLSFSILTNVVAFLPLALVPGGFGKFFIWIPVVVSLAFLISWVEALFVLPAHLAAVRRREEGRPGPARRVQRAVSGALDWVTRRLYGPLLRAALAWRYVTVALMVGILVVVVAWAGSGRMGFGLFPHVPRDYASLDVTLPVGAPRETAERVRNRIVAAADRVIAENGGDELAKGVYAIVEGEEISARAYLRPPGVRPIPTARFARLWREAVGAIPEARTARFASSFGGPGGTAGIEIRLSHAEVDALAAAAARLADELAAFPEVRDPDDGFTPGKEELSFRLTETGRSLGLTSAEVGAQVRAAFQGVEALAQQEGRNEVTVRVRLPEAERRSEAAIETLLIRTGAGGEVPLYQVAEIERGRAAARITREDGRREITVSANVEPEDQANRIMTALESEILPRLEADFPGLGHRAGGRQETQRETFASFTQLSIPLTLALMYGLLAIPFRSYVQPAIVMMAIPFGFVGAVLGHLVMGMSLSMISIFGVIALAGVVINAAIVMIDYANRARDAGTDAFEAIRLAGLRRFRPIVLTTLTTFGGLAPMIFETSRQAKFLIPMAVSLGYGILFATVIVLLLIPALYLVLDDLRWLLNPPRRGPAPGGGGEDRPAVAAE